MGFELIKDSSDRYQVKLSGEPEWVLGMHSASEKIAPEVQNGSWLIVAFSIWSTPDREEAYEAIEVAKSREMCVHIGLLPYDYPEELLKWLPSGTMLPGIAIGEKTTSQGTVQVDISQEENTSPLWFTMLEGNLHSVRQGPLQTDELIKLLSTVESRQNNSSG